MLQEFSNEYLFTPGDVSSAFVNSIFPNYEHIFGSHDSITALVLLNEPPVVNVRQERPSGEAELEFIVVNPMKHTIESISIEGTLSGDLDFWLRPNVASDPHLKNKSFSLGASLRNAAFNITKLQPLFFSEITIQGMAQTGKLDMITDLLKEVVNEEITLDGAGLPIFGPVDVQLPDLSVDQMSEV